MTDKEHDIFHNSVDVLYQYTLGLRNKDEMLIAKYNLEYLLGLVKKWQTEVD